MEHGSFAASGTGVMGPFCTDLNDAVFETSGLLASHLKRAFGMQNHLISRLITILPYLSLSNVKFKNAPPLESSRLLCLCVPPTPGAAL